MLSFGVVICTYNRSHILEKSLEFWSKSKRLPDQIVVVDATSHTHDYKSQLVHRFSKTFSDSKNLYISTQNPGLTRQRNIGLDVITTDIVCFADDDAFIKPDYVEKIIDVFERDPDQLIGGVNGVASGQFDQWQHRKSREMKNYLRHHFGHFLQRIHIPNEQTQVFAPLPSSLKPLPLIHIDRLWGANMNYRTSVVKKLRFDENFIRYGLYEDVEISTRVGQTHKLVCRLDAELEHDDDLGVATRPNDVRYFLISWLNSTYIIEKLFPCAESRAAQNRLFKVINLAPKMMSPQKAEQKTKSLGNDELRQTAALYMSALRDCKDETSLAKKFLDLQEEIFSTSSILNK